MPQQVGRAPRRPGCTPSPSTTSTPQTIAAIRVNGLTGKASDYKLYAKGTDGQYHAFTGSWPLENASGRLRAQKVYEIRFTLQDGGDFDRSTDAKEVTAAILLAR